MWIKQGMIVYLDIASVFPPEVRPQSHSLCCEGVQHVHDYLY